jgi:tryptophan synthase beta chain
MEKRYKFPMVLNSICLLKLFEIQYIKLNKTKIMESLANILTDKKNGYFGKFGGAFVPPVLAGKLLELELFFDQKKMDPAFLMELAHLQKYYIGRPSPLYFAKRLSEHLGCRIFLKREDLNHTGSHKINNCIGQILLAKHMGAREIIAETGAGQHGVATATAAALMGMKCKVFMGSRDAQRQRINVNRMKLLGCEVYTTDRGTAALKDAVDAALEYYVGRPDVFYLLGSAVGPHPYPSMVRFFQEVIGREAREQIFELQEKLPDAVVACIGGGSNAIGLFSGFLNDHQVALHGAEGGGDGLFPGRTASTLSFGNPAVFQGTFSYCLTDDAGNPVPSYSFASGLDYPGVGPEHAHLKETGRAHYHCVTDAEAIQAFVDLSRLEGICPAIESSHALALTKRLFQNTGKCVIVNLSGRGDKDAERISEDLGISD